MDVPGQSVLQLEDAMSEITGKELISKELAEQLPAPDLEVQPFLFEGLVASDSVGAELRRRAGRPKGSLNKAQLSNKEYCLRHGYMPFLDIIGSRASMTPAEIAEVEGIELPDAINIWKFCVEQYGEFTEKKQPKLVEAQVEQKVAVVKKYVVEVDENENKEIRDFQGMKNGNV